MKESTTDQPWYHEGLHFQCTMCGDCCTGAPGYVWVNEEEIQAVAEFLSKPVEQIIERFTRLTARGRTLREKANHDCVFLKSRQAARSIRYAPANVAPGPSGKATCVPQRTGSRPARSARALVRVS